MHVVFRRSSLVAVGALLALAGCMSDGSGPTAIDGALTSGRVDATGGARSGVGVRAYAVASDGSLSAASDAVTTSSEGRYALHVTLPDSATALVVRAEDGTNRMTLLGRAAVDSDVAHARTITLAPIDAGSTFTAALTLALEASENVSIEESSASSLFLSPDAAARLSASADRDATMADAIDAVSSARATFLEGLSAATSGSGSTQLALRGIADEEARLAARLDVATHADDAQAAYATYLDGVIDTTSSAGFSGEAIVTASLAASSALDANVGARMSGSRAELHVLATFAVTSAVDAGLAGMLDSSAIRSASAILRANVQTMAHTGASADAGTGAWVIYVATIRSETRAQAPVSEALVATLATDVTTATDTLVVRWSQAGPSASASERVQALLDCRANVESAAHMALLADAGLSQGDAHAMLDALTDVSASIALH